MGTVPESSANGGIVDRPAKLVPLDSREAPMHPQIARSPLNLKSFRMVCPCDGPFINKGSDLGFLPRRCSDSQGVDTTGQVARHAGTGLHPPNLPRAHAGAHPVRLPTAVAETAALNDKALVLTSLLIQNFGSGSFT